MKPTRFSFLIMLFFITSFLTQCSSDDDSSGNEGINCNNPSGDIISASIDGTEFCSVGVIVVPTGFEEFDGSAYLLQGMNQSQELLIISIPNEPGTYDIPAEGAAGGYTPDAINSVNYLTHEESPASGTLTLEEITSERARGSFEFTAYRVDANSGEILQESVTVTNGNFDIALPVNN